MSMVCNAINRIKTYIVCIHSIRELMEFQIVWRIIPGMNKCVNARKYDLSKEMLDCK